MAKIPSMIYLKETIPEQDWSWVFPALRQDPLIWTSLQDKELLHSTIKQIGSDSQSWTPMNIAFVALGVDLAIVNEIGALPLQDLSPYLSQQAAQTYEDHTSEDPIKLDIRNAGLLALFYLEHNAEAKITAPRTSLACLYDLLPDPSELLFNLNPETAVHVVLSNPLKPDDQVDVFLNYLEKLDLGTKLSTLKRISLHRPTIAIRISREILKTWSEFKASAGFSYPSNHHLNSLATILANTEILAIANQDESLLSQINSALTKTTELQTELTTYLIERDISSGNIDQAYSRWKQIEITSTPTQTAKVVLALIANEKRREAVEWFRDHLTDENRPEPEYLLAKGFIDLQENNTASAKNAVLKSLVRFSELDEPQLTHIQQLTRLAMAVDLPAEALEAISLALEQVPNDINSLNLLRECQLILDQKDKAIQTAHLAVALKPDSMPINRNLAKTLEVAGQWSHAMQVRNAIMTRHDSLEPDEAFEDAFYFATCSLHSNHHQNTAGICQKLLKVKPDDPKIHHLMGETYSAMGDFKKAQSHFTEATRLAPDSAKSWLALANTYLKTSQRHKQKEILQAALNIISDNPELFLRLGEIHLDEDSPTLALQQFRTAHKIVKTEPDTTSKETRQKVSLLLGNTLNQLGHNTDARAVLEDAYQADKEQMDIAHAYARTLLATEAASDALQILNETRKKTSAPIEITIDYARACLATRTNLDETIDNLKKLLESKTNHSEAIALLAEAYEANNEYELALQTYREALEASTQNDPDWITRLSLGLGRVYTKLNQPENAIAVLNNALQNTNDEQKILKTLSGAYDAANLREKAIWAAKSVLDIAPGNQEDLDWFIKQAISLNAASKAIDVLEKTLDKESPDASLFNKLGSLYVYQGDFNKAQDAFLIIKNLEQVTSDELYQASRGLMSIGSTVEAIELIEKAIHLSQSTGDIEILPKLYWNKILAYQVIGSQDKALDSVDTAIQFSPFNPGLIKKKAEILLEKGTFQEAENCIEAGIEKFPENPDLHLQAAIIYRTIGRLLEASGNANKALTLYLDSGEKGTNLHNLTIIADIARAFLDVQKVNEIINAATRLDKSTISKNLHFHCLQGETALESNNETSANDALKSAIEINPTHPRVLALQSRLIFLLEGYEAATKILQNALVEAGNTSEKENLTNRLDDESIFSEFDFMVSTYHGLAEASIELKEWDAAIVLLRKALDSAPDEPQTHFQYARSLVMRAEYQRNCDTVEIIRHAPGKSATATHSYKEFENSILQATHMISKITDDNDGEKRSSTYAMHEIAMWLARGQAVFHPSHEHAQALKKLPETPENTLAYLASLQSCGRTETARIAAQKIRSDLSEERSNPYLLGQVALALSEDSPEEAFIAGQKAIEFSQWQHLPDEPFFHAIIATIAEQNNNQELQKQALEDALEIWDDEPIWIDKLAELLLHSENKEDIRKSIQYLERATQLEPKKPDHYLKLGKAHKRLGNIKGAIVVLDQATRAIPKRPEPWLALAKAHFINNEIPQAIRCAKTVIQIDPSRHEAQLLLAEISLEVTNPQKAAVYVDETLKQAPEDPDALVLSAKIYNALNEPERALDSLEKAIPILPDSISLQLQRVKLIEKTRGTKNAMESLLQLKDKHPQNCRILTALADIYSKHNDTEQAIKSAQEALNSPEGNLNKKDRMTTLTLLGRLLRKTGQLDQSIHFLNLAIDEHPQVADAFVELGRCYHDQRQYDRAIQYLNKAIELVPDDHRAYYFAGLVLKEIKDYVNAESMFKTAAKLAPKNMNVYRQLAAVTAVNFVQSHQSRSDKENKVSVPISMESTKK